MHRSSRTKTTDIHPEVAPYPSRGAVTDVSKQVDKERAKTREFRLLDFLDELGHGEIPDNKRILQGLSTLRNMLDQAWAHHQTELSEDGRALVQDLTQLTDTITQVVRVKNEDEVLQKLAFHASLVAKSSFPSTAEEWTAMRQTEAMQTAERGLGALGTLLKLLVSSPEFRKLLREMISILSEAYGYRGSLDASEPGKGRGRSKRKPHRARSLREQGVRRTPTATEEYRMHSPGERMRPPPRKERPRRFSPSSFRREHPIRRGDGNGGDQYVYERNFHDGPPIVREVELEYDDDEATYVENGRLHEVDPREWPYGEPILTAELPTETKRYLDVEIMSEPDLSRKSRSYYRRRTSKYEAYDGNKPAQWRRSSSRGYQRREGHGHNSDYESTLFKKPVQAMQRMRDAVPVSSRRKLMRRLLHLLRELSKNPEWQEAIEYLVTSVTVLADRSRGQHVDANVYAAAVEFKRLLESFAQTSLTPFLNAVLSFSDYVRKDPHLATYLEDLQEMGMTAMSNPEQLDSDQFRERLDRLLQRGRMWSRSPEAEDVVYELTEFVRCLQEDHLTATLQRDVGKVMETALYEESGRMTFKPDLFNDFRVVFLPALVAQLKYIALPRIEHRDQDMDLILDNVILTSKNFFPNMFTIEMINRAFVSPKEEIADKFVHYFNLRASQIHANIHDVSFYYRKKSGFPRLKDWGVADLQIARQGITIDMSLEYNRWAHDHTLRPLAVRVDIDDLRVKIHHTKHDTFYKATRRAIEANVRRAIIENLESTLYEWLRTVDSYLTSTKARLSSRTARKTRAAAPSFLRSFVPGFLRRYYGRGRRRT